MKKDIHPQYYNDVVVKCICWNEFTISGATVQFIKVEACPACHPTYTGQKTQKVTKWRLQVIMEKMEKMKKMQQKK